MLPYKIRKPVYSGASKHFLQETKPAASEDADRLEQLARDDPRLLGGNLQKAILLDLMDLREHFFERENSNSTFNSAASASSQPVGTSFGRFKATFRDRRFGAIHTRTAPRNVDRGEYAQLLYSCCFYLLEESIADDDVNAQKHKFNLPKSVFAIFTLYALHQTNPLPISPPTRQCTPKTNYNYSQDDALREAWSALPISREEQNLYRKCYKSPVRIDRKNYLLLLQLSDVCKAILAQIGEDIDESSRHFGMAQDASYIIDKMLFTDNFFIYCEYHGPCGLEGLAGNPHFYKEHFVKQKKKSKKGKSSKNGISTGLLASSQLRQDKLEKMKNDEHLTEILNVSVLSDAINKHKLNLQNITAQLQKSRLPGGDLQPKQREVVENTLSGVINSHQAYLSMTTELNGKYTMEASGDGIYNDVTNVLPEAKVSDQNEGLPLVFPEPFSSELRGNIREALADFSNEVAIIRNSVMDEIRASNTPKDAFVIDTSNSIVVGGQGDRSGGQTISDILAFFDVQSETSDALEVNDKVDMEDEISLATGAGKNTLETLLKMAQNKMDTGQLDDDSASSEDSKSVTGTEIDDNSVATSSGINALQNLLSQTTGGSAKQLSKRPAKSAKSKGLSSSGRPNRQKAKRATKKTNVEDDISVATGAGKNALSSLLKMAEDDVASEDGSVSASSKEQKRVNDATNDDNSVATGMKALQNLICQTADTTHNQTPKRKKSPTKLTKSRAAPSTSRQKRQKTKKEPKQTQQRDNDGEVSINYTRTATSLSEKDDISVASTSAAGKDALAALLSQVEKVEEV